MPIRLNLPVALVIVTALLFVLRAAPVAAQTPCDSHEGRLADLDTREQLKAFVNCAAAHVAAVGLEQAAQDFESSTWMDGSLFLFAADTRAVIHFIAGSGEPAGTDMWELQDSDGHLISQDMVRIAQNFGAGYSYYRITNRETGREEPKVSYVKLFEHDGEPIILGAGYHPQDTHATCSPDVVRASLVYHERDVERFVACAGHHLQQQGLQALHDFNSDPRWSSGPTYLFFYDLGSAFAVLNAGQPHLVGTDRSGSTDPDGVKIMQEMQRILRSHDDGYVYYRFRNPATEEEGRKTTYVRRVLLDGREYLLAAGLYVPSLECSALPLARDIDTRDELEQYVRCAAQLIEERGALAWDLFLNHPQWIGGSAYIFVLDDLCRQLVYPLDYERAESDEPRCDFRDAEGNLLNQDILDTARSEAGAGWVRYRWLNPASDEVEAKHSFVVGGTLDGGHISIGAGLYETQLQEPSD